MKKTSTIILLILTILLSGCMSTEGSVKKNANLNFDDAYLAGHFGGMSYDIYLKNLETGKKVKLTFDDAVHPQIAPITPGKYAIVKIDGRLKSRDYDCPTPRVLMRVLELNGSEIVYLGRFIRHGTSFSFSEKMNDNLSDSVMSIYTIDGAIDIRSF
ncbi:MAG: hypothetical protein PQJ60_05165 [Spirochaetales bacterium]|nr:hypothetical protein [Spirochaetales bacterium]